MREVSTGAHTMTCVFLVLLPEPCMPVYPARHVIFGVSVAFRRGRDVGSLGSLPYENSHEDCIMTKKLKKVHEPVAERDPEDKPKFVEVHNRNPLFAQEFQM